MLEAAELPLDDALIVRVDLGEIEARIEARLTAVRSVDASRQWPHDIRIEIEEWQPLAVVIEGSSYTFLAESGDTFTFAHDAEAAAGVAAAGGRRLRRRPAGARGGGRGRGQPWTTR